MTALTLDLRLRRRMDAAGKHAGCLGVTLLTGDRGELLGVRSLGNVDVALGAGQLLMWRPCQGSTIDLVVAAQTLLVGDERLLGNRRMHIQDPDQKEREENSRNNFSPDQETALQVKNAQPSPTSAIPLAPFQLVRTNDKALRPPIQMRAGHCGVRRIKSERHWASIIGNWAR
jgi:hypothetical protein